MRWLNEPPDWTEDEHGLSLRTAPGSDFWRHTHYGFVRSSGHARLRPVAGDFSARVRFSGAYSALYDQAGLLLYLSETHWIKAGVEFTDGQTGLSVVVTRERSDWSVSPAPDAVHGTTIRLTRRADSVLVEAQMAGKAWTMLRLCDFPGGPAEVGEMACSPEGPGWTACFEDFHLGPPEGLLHAGGVS